MKISAAVLFLVALVVALFSRPALRLIAGDSRVPVPVRHQRVSDSAKSWVKFGDDLMQKSRDGLDTSLYGPAALAYERALQADDSDIGALLGLAWVRNSEHSFAEGERWARKALAVNPDLPEAYALMGDGAVELGEYDSAFEHFQRALDLRPDLSSYSRAGHLLWLTGDVARGVELMRLAISTGGDSPEHGAWCRAQLATMLFHSGQLEEAERIVDQGLRLAPGNTHLLAALGRVLAARGDLDGAIAAYRGSVSAAPIHEALAALVDLHALRGDEAEAKVAFEAVRAFHAAHAENHPHPSDDGSGMHTHSGGHGSAQLALFLADHDRDLETALAEAKACHATFPNVFSADALAWCLFKSGELVEAEAMIREAVRWKTPVADLHFHAGMVYASMGNSAEARRQFVRMVELNPQFHPRFADVAKAALAGL